MHKISIIGLGKLGLCIAASFASKGYKVIGIELNKNIIDSVNKGKTPFVEPRLQEFITKFGKRIKATQDYEEAIKNSNITYLITPTPSKPDGHFSERYLRAALEPLAIGLRKNNKKGHLFVITSTVSPGTTDKILIPLIEECSGKKKNSDFGVCYNPAFIALGTVIRDFLNPSLVLIGESDKSAGAKLVGIYKHICGNRPYIARVSIVSAEITKLSMNAYVTMKISFANALANICEWVPEADIDAITRALGADKRIAPFYLKGGPAFGGPCFPRDNRAFVAFAKKYGREAKLAEATDMVNDFQIRHLKELLLRNLSSAEKKNVSILGLAYKPDTPVIEESSAIRLIGELLKGGANITVYDPLAMDNVKALFGDRISYASSAKECLLHSHLWVIMLPLKEFKTIDQSYVTHSPTFIIDCWRVLDRPRLGDKVKYIPLGKFQT